MSLQNVESLKPTGLFTNYIYKAIPLVFDESMSYYETLLGLLAYLKNTVIPTVNNNADAVIELQNLYTQLHDYVENYFNNLDVQQEINNKLDQMTQNGTLTQLIEKYVDPIYQAYENRINDQIDSINTKVSSVASGSPAGVFDTFSSLQSTNPDHSKIYLVTENGNWYFWNTSTSQWTSGGVYQSTEFAENSITPLKTTFALPGNLIDLNNKINLYFTGNKFVTNENSSSVIVKVEPNSNYILKTISTINNIMLSSTLPANNVEFEKILIFASIHTSKISTTNNTQYLLINYSITKNDPNLNNFENNLYLMKEDFMDYNYSSNNTFIKNQIFNKISSKNIEDFIPINIFDKDNACYSNIAASTANQIAFSKNGDAFILKVKPNNTYYISKSVISSRFYVMSTQNFPNSGEDIIQNINNNSGTELEITLGNNENYITVFYYLSTYDTQISKEQILEQMMVNENIKKNQYYPPTIFKLSDNIISNKNNSDFDIDNLPDYIINNLSYKPLGELSNGYLCLIADDGSQALIDYTIPMLKEKNVPCTFALMSESQVVQNEQYFNQVKYMINNYNCSICQHGTTDFSQYTSKQLIKYLNNEKDFWSSKSINVTTLCYPNHINNQKIRTICGGLYNFCANGNTNNYYQYQTNGSRSNAFSLTRTSIVSYDNINQALDYAIENNKLLIVFWHDISIKNSATNQQKLENFIDYAKSKNITFITLDQLTQKLIL